MRPGSRRWTAGSYTVYDLCERASLRFGGGPVAWKIGAAAALAALLMGTAAQAADGPADKGPPKAEELSFRFMGPARGNRVASVAGVPGDPNTWYAGAASGGVWKSEDGGDKWKPVFDDQPVSAIGALAVAASDPKIVWAGTGEAWAIRDADIGGKGVYKSADGGKTWTHMGLDAAGRIGRVIIDPSNSDSVYVCATGRLTGEQQERGVFHTSDGGRTWKRSLFVDPKTGCSGLAMDPKDHRTLYAGTWQVEMHTWGMFSGGAGSGVYVTRDGGETWKRIEAKGLPHSPVGKIDVAVAPTDPSRVYALIETDKQGSLWRSDDAGETWRVVSWDRSLIGRAGYYIRLAVAPDNPDKVLVASSAFHVSEDGGKTFKNAPWGGDNHDIWMDPSNPSRFAISFDGGLAITTSGGKGFHNVTLPIGQMYHVAVDDQVPYLVYGNMQDDGTMRGPSVPMRGGAGWDHYMGGCESGFTLPEPGNPDVVWASCYGDEVTRWDAKTGMARSVSPWLHTLDSAPTETKYRCHWTPPLAIDPFDPKTVYYGCQVIFRTSNEGQSWQVISPDLSTKDPKHIVSSGGLIADNLGQFYGEVVFAIAPSKVQKGLIWAGTNDGKLWYTTDAGGRWNDVTANLKGLPPLGVITSIEPSHFDAGAAYITVDRHLADDRAPYIFKTTDFGRTWTKITGGLPTGELTYVRNVSEDPNARGLLFAGLGAGLFYSADDGANWKQLKTGLPPAPVTWTVVQPRFHDLVISTWGRGFYILDDISPLEQQAAQGAAAADPVRLYTPRPTYQLLRRPGAFVNFELKSEPSGLVKIEVLDEAGQVVRTLERRAHTGFNRIPWDMRFEPLETVKLRTTPPENPYIWEEEAKLKGKDVRPVVHWGMSPYQPGPLVTPGHYQLRLTVGDQVRTAPLEVLSDPKAAPLADTRAMLALQLRIRDDVARVSRVVNQAEWLRRQLEQMAKACEGRTCAKAAAAQDARIQDVEYQLFSRYLAAGDDKTYQHAYKAYFNLLWLNAEVGEGAGDVAGGAHQRPTDTAPMLLSMIEADIAKGEAAWSALIEREVPAFNRRIARQGGRPLDLHTPKEPETQPDREDDEEDADAAG